MSEIDPLQTHDIKQIVARFPELTPTAAMNELSLKELEAKYGLVLQIADQALRARELGLREQSARIDRWANPLTVGVLAGALGLAGTVVNGVWSNINQRSQLTNQNLAEKTKLQNDLIKEAIKPAEERERAKSLVFFAKNGLISLDEKTLTSLIDIAGSDRPVPGSSAAAEGAGSNSGTLDIAYDPALVDRIVKHPGAPYPAGAAPTPSATGAAKIAIILHAAFGPDGVVRLLRDGRPGLPGPLAHWAVLSDGRIESIADEGERASHVGQAREGISNSNTIGIEVTGLPALASELQVETLVRLVADIADRWNIPTDMILSHAEVAVPLGRKSDMQQQAPVIRKMVAAVRERSL